MNYFLYISNLELQPLANKLCAITNKLQIVYQKPDCELFLYLDEIGLWIYSDKLGNYNSNLIYTSIIKRTKLYKNELLMKATKNLSTTNGLVFDLTAGLGKDSFLMAASGYRVVMVEQNPFLVTIIGYFMYVNKNIYKWLSNLTLIYANSIDFISQYSGELPNIIYLDPMFDDKKSALSKKDMQLIQLLNYKFGYGCNDIIEESLQLFKLASQYVNGRLVVKRDNKQPPLVLLPKYSYQILGKTVRYDVYLI